MTDQDGHEGDSWADLDAVRASKLKARPLLATDFPDLNLEAEEAELKIKRTRAMKAATIDIAARRLRVVSARCAGLTGAPDKSSLLAAHTKKWFGMLVERPLGEVIAAVGGSSAEAESED